MAGVLPNKPGTGYWQTVTLQYADGFKLTVTLDIPTIEKLENGDNELMEKIRTIAKSAGTDTAIPGHSRLLSTTSVMAEEEMDNSSHSESVPTRSVMVEAEIDKSSSSEELSYMHWPREAVRLLISLYKEFEEVLEDPKQRKKDIWKIITDKMTENGYNFTQNKVESKWRSLLQSHKDIRVNNASSGKKRKTFQYYEEIEEIVAKRHDIYPKVKAGSDIPCEIIKCYSTKSTDSSPESLHSDASELKFPELTKSVDNGPTETSRNKGKEARTRNVKKQQEEDTGQQVLQFLKESESKHRQESEARESKRDERAKERNEILKQILDVLR